MNLKKFKKIMCLALALVPSVFASAIPVEASFGNFTIGGELATRLNQNFDRLEQEKYRPQNVFLTEEQSGNWPGDTEGRTILALTLDAQATNRTPIYLDTIISLIPNHLNKLGYMGTIHTGAIDEQQLSGHGWLLRGLCEYYRWRGDEKVLDVIKSVVYNLFMPWRGLYSTYPIDPNARKRDVGAESGSVQGQVGRWRLSSDVGCVYIGAEGLIHAYDVLRDPEIEPVIEEILARFLEQDVVAMRAQTHATLTACRGLIRYGTITGKTKYIDEANRVFRLYLQEGMTPNYENYNWFARRDTWTEPCAIVDSYMVAMQLWQHTGDASLLDVAERIYYNALGHTQRANGGFGCDNCPGPESGTPRLMVSTDEAHWCCTMRGGEGLSRVAQYGYYASGDTVWVTRFAQSDAELRMRQGSISLEQNTTYPQTSAVEFKVHDNSAGEVTLALHAPEWLSNVAVKVNGTSVDGSVHADGFVHVTARFAAGDVIRVSFTQKSGTIALKHDAPGFVYNKLIYSGPLLLGYAGKENVTVPNNARARRTGLTEWQVEDTGILLRPVYHLMDENVNKASGYSLQILF